MTRLIDEQQPLRPSRFQQQGPACNCVIDGKCLGWLSCSAYGCAHLVDRATAGRKSPSGCSIRRGTGDTMGGLTINQVAYVAETVHGVHIDARVGSNVVSPAYLARQLRAGRPVIAQGDAIAFKGTHVQSTAGAVAHLVMFNHVRGGTLDNPSEVLMYDSAADGDRHGWGTADQGPTWISWTLARKFMAALRPSGPGTDVIGPKWCYAGIGPDTEPHVRLITGAIRSTPFPDRARAKADGTKIHSRPTIDSPTLYRIDEGRLVRGYQIAHGDAFRGSTEWLGNDAGDEWVHSKRLDHYAGAT